MELPDSFLLGRIKQNQLYLDKKSIEPTTNVEKPKYKLAGTLILSNYLFHVLTRNSATCMHQATISIDKHHWEDVAVGDYLSATTSYCDLAKYDIIEKKELLGKMKDRKNLFPYIAKLCSLKCIELTRINRSLLTIPFISDETKSIIEQGLSDNIEGISKKLGLE